MEEPKPGEPPDIADASSLFGDDAPPRPAPPRPGPVVSSTDGAAYALEETEPLPTARPPRASAAIPSEVRERPRGDRPRPPEPSREEPGADVSQVWTRGEEWGADLVRLGIGVLIYVGVVYSTFSIDALGAWVLIGFVGLLALIALAYPIFVTLERPVRVTPEQAVKDYYDALDHRFPHFRRMWLLLSDTGKAEFDGFADFRDHWRKRLAAWRTEAGLSGPGNPIRVLVDNFRTEGKSAGVSRIDGEFTAIVVGADESTPIRTVGVKIALVKGTDRMWYLRSGKLPGG